MRGIRVDGNRLRQRRRARGLTQHELARRAGVAERTVRNAEAGRQIRLEFLNFLATALELDVCDLVDDRDELRLALREQGRVQQILTAIDAHVTEQDQSELFQLVVRDVLLISPGPTDFPMAGEYRGVDGLRTYFDRSAAAVDYEAAPTIDSIRSSGNLVVISGSDRLRVKSTGKLLSPAWMHVYEFEKGRIVRLDVWSHTATVRAAFQPG